MLLKYINIPIGIEPQQALTTLGFHKLNKSFLGLCSQVPITHPKMGKLNIDTTPFAQRHCLIVDMFVSFLFVYCSI